MTSPPMPTATPDARTALLAALRASGLLTAAQFDRAASAVPADAAGPADAARALVAAGHLTRFQAERLLAGKTDGFCLGPYVIQEQVGRGAMGRVYKARHRTMNRPVAVKLLAAELTRTAVARQAFQREVRAAARLNHPNIVTAYDANELAERFYLVLEFVDGPNLDTLVRGRGPLPVAEACELARQVAVGLDHAHAHGMVHRDIKPANLLVSRPSKTSPESVVKIADFGIAKLSPAAGTTPVPAGGLLGTPDYVAPEQARDPRTADHRADLYSLGAVLYFLLAGRPPFAGGTAEDKVRRHLWEEPPRLELLRPDVPPPVASLVHQMLAKNPAARPASAAEVAARLEGPSGAGGDVVCFDLPAIHPGPHSFTGGHLSGGHAVPLAQPVQHSGGYVAAGWGRYVVHDSGGSPARGGGETSPWEQITHGTQAELEQTPVSTPSRKTKAYPVIHPVDEPGGLPGWAAGLLAAGILGLSLGAILFLIKIMSK